LYPSPQQCELNGLIEADHVAMKLVRYRQQ
jgi:hypothetical protein